MFRRILLLVCLAHPALSQTSPMLEAMRARDWAAAHRLAGTPLGNKLVDFIRLLTPEQAAAGEILDFLAANPGWPDRPVLEQRYGDALARDADEREVARFCAAHRPSAAPALLRCAEAFGLSGARAQAEGAARDAWVSGMTQADEEAAFLARWGAVVTPADQRARFTHLATTNPGAAARQLGRLDSDFRALGVARLALRREDPDALALLAAVPEALRNHAPLLLDQARYLRRTHAERAAAALWQGAAGKAEAALPPGQRAAYWAERDSLARALMGLGAAQDAYAVAQDPGLPQEQAQESTFLSGWIALRGLHDAALARPHFQALSGIAHAAISLARAQYWLGRSAADPAAAQSAFKAAAAWPLTFYGQKSALASGETEPALRARIAALRDPDLPPGEAARVQGSDFFRAAQLLVGWQDDKRAVDFFTALLQAPASLGQREVVAEAALADGMADVAVLAARLAGRDGGALPVSGWPRPVQPPPGPVPPALALAVMRQESSFDPKIVSAAGAHGLMQVMPGTAAELARAAHVASGPLSDPAINMRLGGAYLHGLLDRFGGVVPFAVAAYDAGPHRVQLWLDANRPDAADDDAMIDWIETIPFGETRNYVQRVLENRLVYDAQLQR
jgi:soluble lytic murein transglycosylase